MDRTPGHYRAAARRLFPAHAGMDRVTLGRPDLGASCSPHTRGWTGDGNLGSGIEPLFPAHAGMDPSIENFAEPNNTCSPHTRGWTESTAESPNGKEPVPRTRGDGPGLWVFARLHGMLFPAHAGMDRAGAGPP